ESQHWFLQVDRGGVEYVAELGYYAATDRAWISLSKSEAASTPSEAPSANKTITFGTVPTPASSAQSAESQPDLPALATVAKIPMGDAQQVPETLTPPRVAWIPFAGGPPLAEPKTMSGVAGKAECLEQGSLGKITPSVPPVWTLEQETALARALTIAGPLQPISSLDILEQIELGFEGISSPLGGEAEQPRGFWFSINAEL